MTAHGAAPLGTKIVCGDCRDVMSGMPDGSVDLVFTDPPYSTTNLKFDRGFDMGSVLPEIRRVLKPSGWFFCFASFELAAMIYGGGAGSTGLPMPGSRASRQCSMATSNGRVIHTRRCMRS